MGAAGLHGRRDRPDARSQRRGGPARLPYDPSAQLTESSEFRQIAGMTPAQSLHSVSPRRFAQRARRLLALAAALPVALSLSACAGEEAPASDAAIVAITSPAGPHSAEPFLTTDASGRVHMTWLARTSDSTFALRYASLDGDRWSTPTTIVERGDFFVNWADFPSVMASSGGRLVAHWLQKSGGGKYTYDVRVSQSTDSGRSWSPGIVLHQDGVQAEHGFVAMWPGESDQIEAAWLDGRGTVGADPAARAMHVVAGSLAADGTRGAERTLDMRSCDCCQVAAAVSGRGPIVAYRDRTDAEVRDIVVTRRVDGEWTEPKAVHDDRWQIAACPVNGPALAARGDTVAIAWFTGAQDTARVRYAWSFDGGASFGSPARVDGGNPAGRVDVELLDDGTSVVSWLERADSTTADVRVRRVRADGSMGAPVTVARSSGARASGFPRMTRQGDALVAAWTEPGDSSRIHVARLPLARVP